jgi:hypothetical protein
MVLLSVLNKRELICNPWTCVRICRSRYWISTDQPSARASAFRVGPHVPPPCADGRRVDQIDSGANNATRFKLRELQTLTAVSNQSNPLFRFFTFSGLQF